MKSLNTCVHFTGIQHDACAAGVPYKSVSVDHEPIKYAGGVSRRSWPCLSPNCGGASCAKRQLPTKEEVAADEKEWKRKLDLIFDKGLSACCEAPIDESQVAKSGRHKGTGYRYCSKCKKVVFHGCGGGQ